MMPVGLGVIEGYALTEKGLRESAQRLGQLGVPGWAIQLRTLLLFWGLEQGAPWHPMFAFQSEAMLVGIQLRYPESADRIALYTLYKRVFVRFAQEALRPFVEHANHADAFQKAGYAHLIDLSMRCERFAAPTGSASWPKPSELSPYPSYDEEKPETVEFFWAHSLADELDVTIYSIVSPPETFSWESSRSSDLEHLLELLNRQHQWRIDGQEAESLTDGPYYTEPIASAYLAALEAECPAPEWLPRN
mgnify:CR=1 FL=1